MNILYCQGQTGVSYFQQGFFILPLCINVTCTSILTQFSTHLETHMVHVCVEKFPVNAMFMKSCHGNATCYVCHGNQLWSRKVDLVFRHLQAGVIG